MLFSMWFAIWLFELSDSDLFVIFGKFFENGVEVLGDKHSDPVLKIYEWFEIFCGNCYNLAKLLWQFFIKRVMMSDDWLLCFLMESKG
jgi:hypothetical protein